MGLRMSSVRDVTKVDSLSMNLADLLRKLRHNHRVQPGNRSPPDQTSDLLTSLFSLSVSFSLTHTNVCIDFLPDIEQENGRLCCTHCGNLVVRHSSLKLNLLKVWGETLTFKWLSRLLQRRTEWTSGVRPWINSVYDVIKSTRWHQIYEIRHRNE